MRRREVSAQFIYYETFFLLRRNSDMRVFIQKLFLIDRMVHTSYKHCRGFTEGLHKKSNPLFRIDDVFWCTVIRKSAYSVQLLVLKHELWFIQKQSYAIHEQDLPMEKSVECLYCFLL